VFVLIVVKMCSSVTSVGEYLHFYYLTLNYSHFSLMVLSLSVLLVCFTHHRLGPLACSNLELTSETVSPFRQYGRAPCMGDQPVARAIPTQDSTTHTHTHTKNMNIHVSGSIWTHSSSLQTG
jgi:hypothetical protein